MYNSVHERPRASKESMLAELAAEGMVPEVAHLVARNTLDYETSTGGRTIRLHQTDILIFYKRGGFTINTGGWNSLTTRARLNDYLPAGYGVSTCRGVISLNNTPFKETITVGPRGGIKPDSKPAAFDKQRKAINTYMKEYQTKGLPTVDESGGDPWVFGDAGAYVMQDWIDSKYRHRRMFLLAHAYAGVSETGVHYYLRDVDRQGGKLDRFHLSRIRRYIRHCL